MATTPTTPAKALAQVRQICLALPEATERLSHGSPTFFVRDKKTFVMFVDDHHGDGILGIWCAAPPGVQEQLVDEEPERFFVPPYVGHRGWLGVRLDRRPRLGRGRRDRRPTPTAGRAQDPGRPSHLRWRRPPRVWRCATASSGCGTSPGPGSSRSRCVAPAPAS